MIYMFRSNNPSSGDINLLNLSCWVSVFDPRFVMQYLVSFSSFAIILIGKRELVA